MQYVDCPADVRSLVQPGGPRVKLKPQRVVQRGGGLGARSPASGGILGERRPERKWMQYVDRPADVQSLAEPPGHRRPRMKAKPKRLVPRAQDLDGIGLHRSRRRDHGHDAAIRPPEAQLTVGLSLDLIALFVDRAVVTAAEHGEIGRASCRERV